MVAGGLGTCVVTPSGNVRLYGVKDGHGVFYSESSKVMAQIENIIGKSIPLNSTPVAAETSKYQVVPYNPNATALSSTRLYSVVPEMHELDKERYTFRPK